jgi:hypothetical protein
MGGRTEGHSSSRGGKSVNRKASRNTATENSGRASRPTSRIGPWWSAMRQASIWELGSCTWLCPDRDAHPVRVFDTFTGDLNELPDRLLAYRVNYLRRIGINPGITVSSVVAAVWRADLGTMLSNGLEAPMALRPTSLAGSYFQYRRNEPKFLAGMEPAPGPAPGRTLCSPEIHFVNYIIDLAGLKSRCRLKPAPRPARLENVESP